MCIGDVCVRVCPGWCPAEARQAGVFYATVRVASGAGAPVLVSAVTFHCSSAPGATLPWLVQCSRDGVVWTDAVRGGDAGVPSPVHPLPVAPAQAAVAVRVLLGPAPATRAGDPFSPSPPSITRVCVRVGPLFAPGAASGPVAEPGVAAWPGDWALAVAQLPCSRTLELRL